MRSLKRIHPAAKISALLGAVIWGIPVTFFYGVIAGLVMAAIVAAYLILSVEKIRTYPEQR